MLLLNCKQLLTLRSASSNPGPRRCSQLRELRIIKDAAVLCLGGKIVSVGTTKDALRDPWLKKNRKKVTEVDCTGQIVLPGFVDSHTHPVFVSPRLVDFEKRIEGASYEEIASAGGGIRSSVEGVRRAGKNALAEKVLAALGHMAAYGTTTVEAKTGYGLTVESELKSLEAIHKAASRTRHSIRLAGVLFTVCNDKPGSALYDIEGSIARREIGIREGAGENGRLKILVEDIDGSGKKISSVEEIASSVVAELQALVVGVGSGIIDCQDRACSTRTVPTANGPILGGEEK